MQKSYTLFILLVVATLALSACGGPTVTPTAMMEKPTDDMMMDETSTPGAMMEKPTDDMMMDETSTPDAMMEKPTDDMMMDKTATPQAMMGSPTWFGASLTDVNSGGAFTINDFKGKVVLVETMAVWCTNCRAQQNEIKAMEESLGMQDDLAILSLDIDLNEDQTALKAHAEKYGFDWRYAVAPVDVVREIGNLYTAQFLNPPSTPILIVDRHGVAHPLPFGIKSAADLTTAVKMYLNDGM